MPHDIRVFTVGTLFIAVFGSAAIKSQPPSSAETNGSQRVSLGLQFAPREACGILQSTGKGGVCVLGARPNGAVDRAGIQAHDILQRLGSTDIETSEDLLHVVATLRVGDKVSAVVFRQNAQLTLSIELTPEDRAGSSAGAPQPLPVLPTQLPYEILMLPTETQALVDKVRKTDTALWISGDVLSIVHRDERDAISIGGTFQLPMTRIPATNLWVLQLKMNGWERALFSYSFFSRSDRQMSTTAVSYFRGKEAVPTPVSQRKLQGHLFERVLHSSRLNEDRRTTIYIPPGAKKQRLPTLFMADGQLTEAFARVVEPLFKTGRVEPFAIVGIHASLSAFDPSKARDPGPDRRSQEYLLAIAPEVFSKHMAFLIEEVLPWSAREFSLSTAREDRAMLGFSSGAAFATAVAVMHPDLFANALPFSIGVPQVPAKPATALPHFYFAAGELEPTFAAGTKSVHERMRSWGANSRLDMYTSGHDELMWKTALVRVIPEVFPARKKK